MENRLILGIDNALDGLLIVLSLEDKVIEERHIKSKKNTSEIIGIKVSDILNANGYSIDELNLIIVTLGPGTFTGIRVGLAFCKGLSSGKDIPIIGVPTLDVMAAYFSSFEGFYIFPVIDARKKEVFSSLYHVEHNRLFRKIDYSSKKPQEAVKDIKTPCICFGSGVHMCESFLSGNKDIILIKDGFENISGEQLIKTGLNEASLSKERPLLPIYIRKSEAEIKFNQI